MKPTLLFAQCLTLLLFLSVGCGTGVLPLQTSGVGGLPRQAEEAAITAAKNYNSKSHFDFKDYKARSSSQLEVTGADKANGVEEKWSVVVDFIMRSREDAPWEDGRLQIIVDKVAGSWKATHILPELLR